MHAIMFQYTGGTMMIEVFGTDPGRVIDRYETEIDIHADRGAACKQATMVLADDGYACTGPWDYNETGDSHRVTVVRDGVSIERAPEDDADEAPSGFPDSYRSRKVKGVLEESWYRSEGGVETVVKVVARGRFGAELDQMVRSDFGSDAPPFEFKASVKLSFGDIRKLIGTLTRICDDAEKES